MAVAVTDLYGSLQKKTILSFIQKDFKSTNYLAEGAG